MTSSCDIILIPRELLLANSISKKEVLEYTAKIKELQSIKKMLFDSENYRTQRSSLSFFYDNVGEATEAFTKRKFGEGGVYNPNTPGAWSDSPKVRGSANPYTEEYRLII